MSTGNGTGLIFNETPGSSPAREDMTAVIGFDTICSFTQKFGLFVSLEREGSFTFYYSLLFLAVLDRNVFWQNWT